MGIEPQSPAWNAGDLSIESTEFQRCLLLRWSIWFILIFSTLSQGSRSSLKMHIEGLRSSQRIATNLPLISKAGGSPEHVQAKCYIIGTRLQGCVT